MQVEGDGKLAEIEVRASDVLLRPFRLDDAATIEEAALDPAIPRVTTVPPGCDRAGAEDFIARQAERMTNGTGWPLAIVPTGNDAEDDGHSRPVGAIGLWVTQLAKGRAEIGYWVVESARGRGYASSALAALTDWAFANLDELHRLSLFIEPWNTASIRTGERVGYEREAVLRDWELVDGQPVDMWSYVLTRTMHSRN
ncbi:MAG: GNAT family N-acetyltransferase [Ilumatobacter sp.]|uniref:GNAT family N-acetyltransferase n=1 Tax=Ilumatobacter sp. TaxID=1967498 RepID=UPI003919815F